MLALQDFTLVAAQNAGGASLDSFFESSAMYRILQVCYDGLAVSSQNFSVTEKFPSDLTTPFSYWAVLSKSESKAVSSLAVKAEERNRHLVGAYVAGTAARALLFCRNMIVFGDAWVYPLCCSVFFSLRCRTGVLLTSTPNGKTSDGSITARRPSLKCFSGLVPLCP